jgi:hypothetical protein
MPRRLWRRRPVATSLASIAPEPAAVKATPRPQERRSAERPPGVPPVPLRRQGGAERGSHGASSAHPVAAPAGRETCETPTLHPPLDFI